MGLFLEILFVQLKKIILWLMSIRVLISWICVVITIIYLPKILLNILADKLDRRGKPPIGKHFKEHQMDTITVKFCTSELEKHKDKKAGRKREDYAPRLLVLGYGCEKEVIKSKNEAQTSRKANEKLLLNFEIPGTALISFMRFRSCWHPSDSAFRWHFRASCTSGSCLQRSSGTP